jgi:membrane-associated progesterone receptor component
MSLNPLEAPLNTIFSLSIAWNLFRLTWPSLSVPETLPSGHTGGYNWIPSKHPDTTVFKHYTPKTLVKYDGKDGGTILLAIDRTVFDVTAGRGFYGPGMCLGF